MDRIISAIVERQLALAKSALEHPTRDIFDHGIQAGMYAGLQEALDIIAEIQSGKPRRKSADVSRPQVYS